MRLVILESPFSAPTPEGTEANIAYARAAVRDSLLRGESPIASHLLYTQAGIFDDGIPSERAMGIEAGLAWLVRADATVVYEDRGVSRGMAYGIGRAAATGIPIEYRKIGTVFPAEPAREDAREGVAHV